MLVHALLVLSVNSKTLYSLELLGGQVWSLPLESSTVDDNPPSRIPTRVISRTTMNNQSLQLSGIARTGRNGKTLKISPVPRALTVVRSNHRLFRRRFPQDSSTIVTFAIHPPLLKLVSWPILVSCSTTAVLTKHHLLSNRTLVEI